MSKRSPARVACLLTLVTLTAGVLVFWAAKLKAQPVNERIVEEIDNSQRLLMPGTRSPLAKSARDVGAVPAGVPVAGVSLIFNRSVAQEAQLQALIAAQHDPASALYHQWLTPDQFAARFGMSDSDLQKVQSWLQEQGFSVDSISRSRNRISFSGTAGQIENSFGAALHYYDVNGKPTYALSGDISLPKAIASVTQSVSNLSTLRPKPRLRRPKANFTSGQTGHTFLTPKDVATIYNINPVYTAGFTGKGQSIAVVGQTSVSLTDMENFQTAAGLTVKDPTLVFVPGTGSVATFQGDESESDLDLEYSGAMAPGATIYFVYVGDSVNFSVFDSIAYSIDNNIAPIISDSYGLCEPLLSLAQYNSLNSVLAQGAAQGQSLIVPAGDSGSTDCFGFSGVSTAQQQALAVDFPASSQYVTAMGGTEFPTANVCNASTCSTPPAQYWQTNGTNDVISSALQYIPEQVWNDDFAPSGSNPAGLSSTGGGISTQTARPSWQAGVPGIPSGTKRLVPDVSLAASPDNAGFLYCSSDPLIGVTGSCSHGFRDANTQNLTVAGGTSFDSPIFAGLVAVINEKQKSTGQGIISSTLYSLASNSTTYANAFHDITSGNNNCTNAGSTACSGSGLTQYSAGTGYDLATGLGSINFAQLVAAWPAGSAKTASTTTLAAATNAPAIGANDAVTITVAPGSGSGTPSGTVSVLVDGVTAAASLALSGGSASYNFVSSANGSHVINVTYSGDSTFASSTSSLVVGNQAFRLTSTDPTVTSGAAATSTLTIAPQQGYTGSIAWVVSSSPSLTNGCFTLANATVSNSNAVTATMTINTSATACGLSASIRNSSTQATAVASTSGESPAGPARRAPLAVALMGLLFGGVLLTGRGKVRGIGGLCLVAVLAVALPGCGGGSSTPPPPVTKKVTPGTYSLTVVGTDTTTSSISASTVVTLTVN